MNEIITKLLNNIDGHAPYHIKTYPAHHIIFNQGTKLQEVGLLIDGEIKISTITYNDREETISLIKKGEWFGDILMFSPKPIYLGDVIANKKSQVLFFPKSELLDLLQKNKAFLEFYLQSISQKAYAIKQQNKLLAHKNLKDRILYYLNTQAMNHQVIIKSITTLAYELSIPRPSLSRSLKTLEDEGIIKRNKKIIYIKK